MNIRWIVCFKGDDNHNNTLLCTDLGEVKLKNVFSEISESTEGILTKFVISDYDSTKDSLNIRETQHNPSWNDDTADACAQGYKQIKYRTITVPVGKSLFMEVIHLTPYAQTNFTDAEVCDILEHLLIFLDNKKLILRALCQQMALDCGLYDRINSLLLGPRTEPAQLHSKLLDLALEIGKHICLSVKDHRGNAMLALTEEDINKRLLVDINLSEINRLFVPTVLITSSDFLVHNDDSLCELYANKQSDCEFTVDIELPVLPSDTAAQRLSEVLMCRFLALDSTKKIVIRFRGLECDFNLNFIHGKEIRAVFENCTLMRGSCSHTNLKELTIVNSKITASLVLPDGMEKVTLKNVNVAANGKLRLGRNCKTVVMRNVSGNICVPYLQQNFCIEFNSQWSFELSGHDDEHIGRLLIENVTISSLLVVINQSVHTVILKNIILPSNSILLLQKSVKELLLETFLGTVHLYGAVQAFGPICVEVFDGKLKVEESGIGKRTKIALERAKLTKNAHLDKKISHVDLCDVEIAAGCSLKLHGSEQRISLKNCTGTVFFANIPGFEQIKFGRTLQAEDHLGVIPVQVFLCTRTVMGRMSRLILHFLQFEETVRLCDNTKDIILKNIEIHDEYSLVVGNNFEQLTLQNCRGRVVIPGVSFSEGKQTGLLLNGGQIRIVRLSDDIYDITAENIQFTGDLAFAMRVHAAEICNAGMCAESTITFANECQNLNLQGNVACIRVLAAKTLKTLSLRGTDVSNNSQLLAVPVERFTAENVTMHHRTMSRADVPSVLTSLNIANRSTMVSITNTNVPVNITSIVRHVIRGESPLLTTPDSVFCLNEDPSVQLNELHLAHFHVHSNLEIVREILSLSLKEITAGSNSTIRVNKELESITIDNCLVNIDFTETRGLRSIVLSKTALIYNQVLHLPISYLNLSSVVIDQNVSLNECVKTAKLKDVRIEKDYTFKVNRNIHELDISGSVGIVNMSGIGGLDSMVLEQKHQIRVINSKTPNVTFLYISDYHFNNNMVLPNDIEPCFCEMLAYPRIISWYLEVTANTW